VPIALGSLPTARHRPPTPTPLHPPNPLRCPLRAFEGESARLEQSTPSRALVQSSRAITNSQLISSSPSVNGTKAFSNMQPTGACLRVHSMGTRNGIQGRMSMFCVYAAQRSHVLFCAQCLAKCNSQAHGMPSPAPQAIASRCMLHRCAGSPSYSGDRLATQSAKVTILSRARVHHCGTPPAFHGRRRAEASAGGGDPARDARKALDLAPYESCA
jgi:hypothetical protein